MDIIIYVCSINITLIIILRMKKEQNLKEMVLRDHYNALTEKQKTDFREKVLSESGMSYTTFYYKLRYNTFKPLEVALINDIINSINK